jgi:hypothetical protein
LISTNRTYSNIDEFDNIITVLVGKEEKRFILHQDAVCAKSKFFKAACSKQWREGQEQIVRLPEAGVAAFKAYSAWVYSGDVAEHTCTPESEEEDMDVAQTSLIDLYLLGDTLDDIQLRNKAMSMLFACIRHCVIPSIDNVRHIWESTPSGSFLRKSTRKPTSSNNLSPEIPVTSTSKLPCQTNDFTSSTGMS